MSTRLRPWAMLCALVLGSVARADEAVDATATPETPQWHGFSFRVGGLLLVPLPSSKEVELANVSGAARLAVHDGPIAGSSVGMTPNFMPAVTIGYAFPFLNQQLSLETILALPFTMKLLAGGTLATQSLAPNALGILPTGVPPVGSDLGEVKVLPPVLTAVYRFLPEQRFHPYVGAGVSYLIAYDAKITNPVLTEVVPPKLEVPPALGWVLQGGLDVHLTRWFYATADVKFIGGLALTAKVTDIWVRLPKLPLYEAVHVGDTVAHVTVNPLVFQLGVGMNL